MERRNTSMTERKNFWGPINQVSRHKTTTAGDFTSHRDRDKGGRGREAGSNQHTTLPRKKGFPGKHGKIILRASYLSWEGREQKLRNFSKEKFD